MSNEASERLSRWLKFLESHGLSENDDAHKQMVLRWSRGEEPPQEID